MSSNQATSYDQVTELVIKKLEAGTVPWRRPWSGTGIGGCMNVLTQKPYQAINALLTSMAGYESPWFMSVKQGETLKATVKPGAKGTPIVFYMPMKKVDLVTGKEKFIPMIKLYTVFNASEFDNLRISESVLYPNRVKRPEFNPIQACESVVKGMPQAPRIQHVETRACYSPTLDYVNMPAKELFDTAEGYYATLFHELGHSTGHESRLDRKFDKSNHHFGSQDYSKEELVAEMTAAFLCQTTGIDANTVDQSASYIASWLRVLRNDSKLLLSAAGQAQKAANFIRGIK